MRKLNSGNSPLLGAVIDDATLDALIYDAAHGNNPSVRREAVGALAVLNDARALRPLAGIIEADQFFGFSSLIQSLRWSFNDIESYRQGLENALTKVAPFGSSDDYIGYLNEIVPPTAKSVTFTLAALAAETLGQRREPRAFDCLVRAMEFYTSHSHNGRETYEQYSGRLLLAIIDALPEFSDQRATPSLRKGLGCPNGKVRVAATEALAKMGESQWVPIIKGDDEDFARIAQSGSKYAAELLLQLLEGSKGYYCSADEHDWRTILCIAKALVALGVTNLEAMAIIAEETQRGKGVRN
jgi:hypothetical protein